MSFARVIRKPLGLVQYRPTIRSLAKPSKEIVRTSYRTQPVGKVGVYLRRENVVRHGKIEQRKLGSDFEARSNKAQRGAVL